MAITHKWAVFNLETHFRLTEYTARNLAGLALRKILYDQPGLKGKIGIKQKDFEKAAASSQDKASDLI